ncbi:MAG: phosphatase PAP2 family protein [Neisseriales bacterium]|nr:MAG: phosphatase PAP2 family protein [Neisseriales bacterium]
MIQINKSNLFKSLVIIIILWILAYASILVLDRPLAIFIHQHGIDSYLQLRKITEGMPIFISVLAIMALIIYYWQKQRKVLSFTAPVYFYLMLKLTMEIKTGLKIVFGRYWPKTWINNNLSLIHDNVYGFNWLHGFGNQGSFPSGHSTYVVFCAMWLSYVYPKLVYIWFLLAFFGITCLILLDYHFLGDCFAGIGLGIFCAVISLAIWQRIAISHNHNK